MPHKVPVVCPRQPGAGEPDGGVKFRLKIHIFATTYSKIGVGRRALAERKKGGAANANNCKIFIF